MVAKAEIENIGFQSLVVELGEVEIKENISGKKHDALKVALLKSGLELMDDKEAMLIEKIKNVIVEMIHYSDALPETNFSDYLSKKLNYDYTYLSTLFSEIKGTSIEHFIITHKIDRVKELLMFDELSLSEIAWKLGYSSVAHLSDQFKMITGLSPSFFKLHKHKKLVNVFLN